MFKIDACELALVERLVRQRLFAALLFQFFDESGYVVVRLYGYFPHFPCDVIFDNL